MTTNYPLYDHAGYHFERRHYPERSYVDISNADKEQNLSLVFTGKYELENLIRELQQLLDEMTL